MEISIINPEKHILPPTEITEERFYEALECLPPENWHSLGDFEFFQLCEYYTGNVTYYYAKYKDKYYTFRNVANKSPFEVKDLFEEGLKYFVHSHIYKTGEAIRFVQPTLENAFDYQNKLLNIVDETCRSSPPLFDNDHKGFCMSQIHLNITGFTL